MWHMDVPDLGGHIRAAAAGLHHRPSNVVLGGSSAAEATAMWARRRTQALEVGVAVTIS